MVEGLSVLQLIWVGFAVLAAYVIRGMSGFGAGLIAGPLMAFVLPMHVVIPITGMLVFVLFIFLSIRDRRDANWDELKLLVPPTIVGVVAGLFLFRLLDNSLLLIMLGSFLIVYATYMFAVHALGLPQFSCSQKWALPVAFAGSFFDTLFGGGGGTLIVIYMHARGIGRTEFRATVATLWMIEMIARVGGYAMEGYYSGSVLILVAFLLPLVWLGTWIGEHLGNRVRPATFSLILAALLMLSGISLLFK